MLHYALQAIFLHKVIQGSTGSASSMLYALQAISFTGYTHSTRSNMSCWLTNLLMATHAAHLRFGASAAHVRAGRMWRMWLRTAPQHQAFTRASSGLEVAGTVCRVCRVAGTFTRQLVRRD